MDRYGVGPYPVVFISIHEEQKTLIMQFLINEQLNVMILGVEGNLTGKQS